MQLSARNVFKETIKSIAKSAVLAEVRVDIGGGNEITSTITVSSVERLGLEAGKDVSVITKASDVILGIE